MFFLFIKRKKFYKGDWKSGLVSPSFARSLDVPEERFSNEKYMEIPQQGVPLVGQKLWDILEIGKANTIGLKKEARA
jgi:hypothetical protein